MANFDPGLPGGAKRRSWQRGEPFRASSRGAPSGWLSADERRRILLLLDEADRFLESDSKDGFKRTSISVHSSMSESLHNYLPTVTA